MAFSPVKFLFVLLVFSAFGWILFVFATRLLTWFLSRVLKASVEFRVAGCTCLRDVSVKFQGGAVESISIGEIKLSLQKSLVKLGFSFISGEPKLQLLICDLDIVLRPSEKSIKKSKPRKSRSSGRGKWNLLNNISRYISVFLTDFVLKAPNAAVEIKDLGMEISKNGGHNPELSVKLCLNPLHVQLCDPAFEQRDFLLIGQTSLDVTEKNIASLLIENLMVACEFGHDREQGIKVKNLDLTSGDIAVNLNEALLLKTKKKPETSVATVVGESTTSEAAAVSKSENNKLSSLLQKPIVPEKVSFNFPKLHAKFVHLGQGLSFENNVMGIHLRCNKYTQYEDSGETAHFDVQMDFSEIHLLEDGNNSILEIIKLAVVGSVDVPTQIVQPVRAEIDVKLGGTQCNLVISRLKPLLRLHFSKKKNMVLQDKISHKERVQISKPKTVMWTCTVSAPEVTIVLYGFNDSPVYNVCSQSSHLFANDITTKGIQIHAELGELQLHMSDNYRESLKESLFSVEINSDSLMHISHVSLDWGYQEVEPNNSKLALSVDVTDMGVYFSFHHVESIILTLMSIKALLKSLSGSKNRSSQSKVGTSRTTSSKGTQILKLNLEKCSINYCGDVVMKDMIVADPKRVNYGSQGGVSVISISADGTPRTASITPTAFGGCKKLKFSTLLNVSRLNLNVNKEKKSLQMDLERAKSVYVEYSEDNKPGANVTILDMQSAKFVRRSGGLNEISVCSLINVTDIAVRWEPDFHLAIFEFMTLLKSITNKKKIELSVTEAVEDIPNFQDVEAKKETMSEHAQFDKHAKKKESIFAIDVEKLKVMVELADGVETMVDVQSIFSENARIGVLLEELMLSFNDTRIFKSSRMQISRIPVSIPNNVTDTKTQPTTTWDWVIQGPDVHICIPYRLQLRAIDDAVEDTLRGLKLIATAKTNLLYPTKSSSEKPKSKSSKFGSLRFIIRKLTADIEEEPLQGWLDEHYRMMKSEVCELGIRLKFLDELFSADQNELSGKKYTFNGKEINMSDPEAAKGLRDQIHKQAFQSYYKACKRLILSEGSGSYKSGFQSGFTPSTNRISLLTVSATELDLTLTKIEGGDVGMIEFINKVDPVSLDDEIPFSRMYGRDMSVNMGSLTVQIRDYTYPLFSASSGKCQGRIILAQQATFFQPQIEQDVFIGRWWKVRMLRSASGTSPPMKTYTELPLHFDKAQLSYGVGYEPVFADISFAFTVALRRAVLGTRGNNPMANQPPKKERSLPWWDDMRNYIHGKISLFFKETTWYLLATTNPYEKMDKLMIVTDYMEILQSDGHVTLYAKEFKGYLSSIENLVKNCSLKIPSNNSSYFLHAPTLSIDVCIEWECESGRPLNHYLYTLPKEGKTREKVLDPFRSTSLALRWNISLRPSKDEPLPIHELNNLISSTMESPTVNFGAHDLAWLIKWWNMVYLPPQKLRSFSRWPRFGVPRAVRSGNLSLDKVMTEFFLRIDSSSTCIKHKPLGDDDPASGLTFKTAKLKFERCYSRGKQKFTFESKRDPLDLVYQEIDLHQLKVNLIRIKEPDTALDKQSMKTSQTLIDKLNTERCRDHGFLLESEYFTIRRQSPKADAAKIVAWQEVGRKNHEMMHVRSEKENESDSDHARSDLSDDEDGIVIADNCQRVFVYGLKLLWTIENRDAVWSFVGGISQAFGPSKISPSRQYAQRKMFEEHANEESEVSPDVAVNMSSSILNGASSQSPQNAEPSHFPQKIFEGMHNVFVDPGEITDSEDDGIRHFMVNVIQPQFNLHSEDANGRFLLAAASGRVLARSFHSVLHVGSEMLEKALGDISIPNVEPEMTWKRVELSMMLEQVQAHVAPTDVDPGAGIQWLPKILKSSPKVKRTGALLERVFMPCQMYFRYTRHKGGTPELKVKPLKELKFNSPNITATMTSRQFQVMLDVLTNLLFARLPKPRKSSLKYPSDDNDDAEEESDEVVPDGVEEVELARISIEHREWERKLTIDDVRTLTTATENPNDGADTQNNGELWMITGEKSKLINNLEKDLSKVNVARKDACLELRVALQKAAQLRLLEKEKSKSPSYAMRISMRIDRVVWSMLADGKSFAEAEINDMIYDFDRDYKDIGIALFTTKSCVLRNCLQNAKCDTVLSAWNPPTEWGKNVMVRVNAKQGAPKDGHSLLETFQVDIYPLKIHLTEAMYRMMWGYLFPEEEQDSQRRQEVWKVSTTAGARRVVKNFSSTDTTASTSNATKESEIPKITGSNLPASLAAGISNHGDSSQVMKLTDSKTKNGSGLTPEFRRTSSFDRTWEETVAESVANELVLQNFTKKKGPIGLEYGEETSKSNRTKESKPVRPGRSNHEEKKVGKVADDKRTQTRKLMEFHNIRISQVELLVTYEGSRFAVSDLRLLMDSFYREDFTGTWRRLFSRVKKHIIWGVLKSVTGMQGKKFKDKLLQSHKEPHGVIVLETDLNSSENHGGQPGKPDQFPLTWNKQTDAAGDGFVTSVRGLFNSQRRKAKAFVLRTMRGEAENELQGDWSDSDVEFSPFARQLTITKAKKLIRKHTKKFKSRAEKSYEGTAMQQQESLPSSPREGSPFPSDSSGESSYEDINE